MSHDVVPIDRAGRIVLPKEPRRNLSILPGDTFTISVQGAAVTLTPNKEPGGFLRKGKALVCFAAGGATLTEEAVQATLAAVRDERDSQAIAGLNPHQHPRRE